MFIIFSPNGNCSKFPFYCLIHSEILVGGGLVPRGHPSVRFCYQMESLVNRNLYVVQKPKYNQNFFFFSFSISAKNRLIWDVISNFLAHDFLIFDQNMSSNIQKEAKKQNCIYIHVNKCMYNRKHGQPCPCFHIT